MKSNGASTTSSNGQKRTSAGQGPSNPGLKTSQKTRHRTSLSCKECRRLKLKCDRDFPCSSCRRRGCADICPDGMRKPPGRALEIQAEFSLLAKRVEYLESLVTELGGEDRIPPPLKLQHASKRTSSFLKDLESQIEHASNSYGQEGEQGSDDDTNERMNQQDDDGENGQEEKDDEAKLVIGVGSLSIGNDEAGRYLGASAAPSYYFDEDEEEDDDDEEEPQSDSEQHKVIALGNSRQRGNEEIENYRKMLPPIERGRELAANYYNFLAFQFVPLSAKDFYEDYLPAAYTPNDTSPTKLGAVFTIFSLGTLFDPNMPSTFNEDAQRYFLRGQNVLAAAKALSQNTLATSQSIQLCGSFLLCQHNLKEGGETFFPLLGIASRLLVTQALHRDGTVFGIQGEELNRRRRIFWEFTTIERMQAYISGRPFILQDSQFDTKFPTDAAPFDIAKWQLGTLIGKIINEAFSLSAPSHSTILKLDDELRDLVRKSPESIRSGVLPPNAFLEKPQFVPQLPPSRPPSNATLIEKLQQHTMDQMFSQVLFYLHKPLFAQALLHHSKEPLQSPYRASVETVTLETAVYLVAVAKSWIHLHPVLAPRWWHIYFHAFAAAVSQASLVIKSPSSLLAPHSWTQLKEAVEIFEVAGSSGAPCSLYIPRLKVLQEKAYTSLQNLLSIPLGLGDGDSSDALLEGEVSRSILNPPARLERRSKPPSSGGASPVGSGHAASQSHNSPSPRPLPMANSAVTEAVPYSPFDAPIFPPQQNSITSAQIPATLPSLPPQQYSYQPQFNPLNVQPSSIPQSHPDIDHRSFQSIPNYHSSFPSFPTDSASSTFDLDAYALPRMEFGGFATDFSGGASQEWVQANQPQSNQGGQQAFSMIDSQAFPSYFDFANFAPP